jgi:iron complex outermembrane recepter protein
MLSNILCAVRSHYLVRSHPHLRVLRLLLSAKIRSFLSIALTANRPLSWTARKIGAWKKRDLTPSTYHSIRLSCDTKRLLFQLLFVLFTPLFTAAGQESVSSSEELELLKEEETVSIAVRHEQPISEAPSNVYVITDEDIRHSGAVDIPTVLRRIPGMEVMQTTGADFNVSVRGDNQLNANKLLVLVDGRSIYIDASGQVLWKLLPVTLPEIKRIEVLKGPASAVYGFNAFDGIVNIITKSPEEMKGATLQFGAGEFGTLTASAIQAGTLDKFGYRLSLGWNQNQQWRNRDALGFRDYLVNLHTEYAITPDQKLRFAGGLVDSNAFDGPLNNVTRPYISPQQGYAYVAYERPNFFLRSSWTATNSTSLLTNYAAVDNLVRSGLDSAFNPMQKFRATTYNIEAQHSVDLPFANRLSYGLNYRHNILSYNLIDKFSTENRFGFYLQDEWQPFQPLSVIAGVRYDLDTFINPTMSPRVALLYRPLSDHTFRASISVAYRPPTLLEEHLNSITVFTLPPPFPSLPTRLTVGSHNLQPEQIISYELGYQGWYLKHRLRIRTDLFFNHLSDLITFGQGTPSVGAGVADIYGGEVGMEFLATRWLSGFANYSYQEVGQSFTGDVRRAVPRFKVNAGLRAESENGLNAEVVYHYYDGATYPLSPIFQALVPFGAVPPDPHVGSYNLLNLRAGYRFWHHKAAAGYFREAEVAVSAFNALNDRHKEHPLGDTIGSRVMGWLTLKF